MAQLSSDQFESLWQSVKGGPVIRPPSAKPAQVGVSLSTLLDQYLASAGRSRDKGKINGTDYEALASAISALKAVLVRINDGQLVTEWASDRANVLAQQARTKV
jgi:hypothetical protein